ncbi:GntR family transcriptional regulator, partial [Acinetobacter baumannii]
MRQLASQYVIKPLTVTRALQALSDHGLIEPRRGLGMFVTTGARERLLRQERERFLQRDWPALRARLKRLGLTAKDLNWE